MALESGTKLGSYEIGDLLGKGGMGEVYRARDTKLGREVAIKVLPAEFSQDEERLARLEREARMLAALNHPNIAAIYGLEQSDDTRFLVLELVEGDTLDDRLKRAAVPVEESLKLALQIAEALESAHEKGVIHRDLKPANVKVTNDGKIKVLDFGLAKVFAGEQADANLSNSPTLSMQATQQGMILGTAAYMSPEQARGETADKRADIWAFGCVLFEMLTGRRTFDGKTVSDVLASVLKTDPEWASLPSNLHPRLRLLLERCLEKDAANRYHDIADVRVDIQQVLADPGGVIVQPVPEVVREGTQSKLPWVAAVIGILIASVVVWNLKPAPPPEPRPVSRWQHVLPEARVFRNTGRPIVALSPDGSQFVYNAAGGLYLRQLDELDDRPIPGTEGALTNPTFSPDGEWLTFWSQEDQQLKKIAVVGGAAVTLADVGTNPGGISWDQDETIVYGTNEGVMRVSADGGDPEPAFSLADQQPRLWGFPQLLPEGNAVLFALAGPGPSGVAVGLLDSDEPPKMLFPGIRPRYLSTGHIVYAQGDVLFAVPFDLARLEVTGGPVPLVEGIRLDPGVSQYAVSNTGSLIYVPGASAGTLPSRTLAFVDRSGAVEAIPLPADAYSNPRLSPDGTRLAVQITREEGDDIWVYDFSGETAFRRLTLGGGNTNPIWTPDGERITFASSRDDQLGIYWQAADGSGVAELLATGGPGAFSPASWTPDGRTLSIMGLGQGLGIWSLSLDSGNEPELFYDVEENQLASEFSPDGNWLAYVSGPRGLSYIYVQPFPATGEIRQVTRELGQGSFPVWSADGTELFYRRNVTATAGTIVSVDVSTDGNFTFGTERELPVSGFLVGVGTRFFDVTPDGQRFLMLFSEDQAESSDPTRQQINVVENWFSELRERVPVD